MTTVLILPPMPCMECGAPSTPGELYCLQCVGVRLIRHAVNA